MRTFMRLLLVLVVAAGAVLGIVYPSTLGKREGPEIGRWPVYAQDRGFIELETVLPGHDTPLRIKAELRSLGPLLSGPEREVLQLAVSDETGGQVAASTILFSGQAILESPQTGVYLYHGGAGTMPAANGLHRFAAGAGRDFEDRIISVDLVLSLAGTPVDPRLGPLGLLLMTVGGVGFGLTLFRRRENPNSKPPASRWGRG